MRVLVMGATGFIGRALVLRLLREGHAVTAWARAPLRARSALGAEVTLVDAAGGKPALTGALATADAVINLAGAPVAGGRWTRGRRRRIEDSRIELTERLMDALAASPRRPAVLINASAVGFYGDRGTEPLDETSPAGPGFLAETCVRWERAAREAELLGMRVVRARIGVVLGLGGGFLGKLLPLFLRGLGAQLGGGQQYLPFIHLDDLVEVFVQALRDERYQGAFDVVAPVPATSAEVSAALGRTLHRRVRLRVPAFLLRLALGEAADVVLSSQRLAARRLQALGFVHRHPQIDGALEHLVGQLRAVQIGPFAADDPAPLDGNSGYLSRRRPRYLLRTRVTLAAPLDEVFGFFSRPENLGVITPSTMAFVIRQAPPTIDRGGIIDYSIRVAGAPLRWRTSIEHWLPQRCFVDAQTRGPYRSWWHEHHFFTEGGRTVMEDRVYYAPPLGLLGRIAQALFVAPQLREVFGYRTQAIRQRFRAVPA